MDLIQNSCWFDVHCKDFIVLCCGGLVVFSERLKVELIQFFFNNPRAPAITLPFPLLIGIRNFH